MGEFEHITVRAAGEDDVVIEAGLGALDTPGLAATLEPARATGPDAAPAPASASAPASETPPATASAPASEAPPDPAIARGRGTASAEYRQTLADLESGQMPAAQRIVIIAAVVCIIGALIYYFAFMG